MRCLTEFTFQVAIRTDPTVPAEPWALQSQCTQPLRNPLNEPPPGPKRSWRWRFLRLR